MSSVALALQRGESPSAATQLFHFASGCGGLLLAHPLHTVALSPCPTGDQSTAPRQPAAQQLTSGVLSGVGVSPCQEEPAHTSPPLKALSHFSGVPRSDCSPGWMGPEVAGQWEPKPWEQLSSSLGRAPQQIPSVPKAPLPAVSPTPAVGASQISAAAQLILTLLLLCFLQTSPV